MFSTLRYLLLLALLPALARGEEAPVSPAALAQMRSLQAEKMARSPVQQKIASQLLYAVKVQRGEGLGAGLQAMETRIRTQTAGITLVDISATVTPEVLAAIRALGGRVISSTPAYREIRAELPLTSVETLAARPDVTSIRRGAASFTHAGSRQSEGDIALKADRMRAATRATGRNIKVGVLSDSVDFLGGSQATGDLGPVTILPGMANLGGGYGEGTAMLEIVHDLAPDAELFFASANLGEGSFAQSILDLRRAGCDIIIDDLSYIDEPPFQDGIIARAVNEVSNDGALYFSAEGNEGSETAGTSGTWEGDFADGGPTSAPITAPGRVHRFGANGWNTITGGGQFTLLNWADPLGQSRNDYDLYLLDASGTVVLDASTDVQNGSQDPIEGFYSSTAGSRVVVVKANDAAPRYLRVTSYRGTLAEHTPYSVFGHAAAERAIGVAAVSAAAGIPFTTASTTESFSSDGPRRIFYYEDGSQVTQGNLSSTGGLLRPSPLLAAADGVSTSVPYFPQFYGTSAAAPHAGAVAALVWSRNRGLTRQQVFDALRSSALDIGPAGFDTTSGYGLVDAEAAAAKVTGTPLISVAAQAIVSESFTPANGRADPGERLGVSVTLQNDGLVPTTNLIATLAAVDGVSTPSPAISYGVLASDGTAAQTFTFRVAQTLGRPVLARIALSDNGLQLGSVTVSIPTGQLGAPQSFSNPAPILINDAADATPYPATISVAGFSGILGKVTATLRGFTHTFPGDTGFLLVSPTSQSALLMETAGGGTPVAGVDVTLDDDAPATVPYDSLPAGPARPAQYYDLLAAYSFSAPAPSAPYPVELAGLTAGDPNGDWKLFVRDSFSGDFGILGNGFSLSLYPVSAATSSPAADLAASVEADRSAVAVGEVFTLTARIFNFGAATATGATASVTVPASFRILSGTSDRGVVTVSGQSAALVLPTLESERTATVTLQVEVESPGIGKAIVSAGNDLATVALTAAWANLAPSGSGPLVIDSAAGDTTGFRTTDFLYANLAYTNAGSAPARANFFVDLYLDGVLIRRLSHKLPLAPGGIRRLNDLPLGRLPAGRHTLMVQLDGDAEIVETNKGNNSFQTSFIVTAIGPNLAFSSGIGLATTAGATTDSALFTSADSLFYRFSVANTGLSGTGAASAVSVYLDDVLTDTLPVPVLAANATVSLAGSIAAPLAGGAHKLRLVLDDAGIMAETSEDDNELARELTVNALPRVTSGGAVSTSEGIPAQTAFDISDAETDAADLLISFSSTNPGLLSADRFVLGGSGPHRTLKLIPTIYAAGSATITITVEDQAGGRASASFPVTVTPVNDLPGLTPIADVSVPKHGATGAIPFIVSDPETAASALTVTATSSNGLLVLSSGLVLSGTGSQRSLRITPADHATGTSTITVTVSDGEGSSSISFLLTVTPVNDAPSFLLTSSASAAKDAGPQRIAGFVAGIAPGGPDENAQTVSFVVSAATPGLFKAQPALDAFGALTFTPSPIASGSTSVTVRALDSEGASSPTQTFTIAITSVQEEAGTYHGLIVPLAPQAADRAGAISLALTANGAASGRVTMSGGTLPFRAAVSNAGAVSFPPGGSSLRVGRSLYLTLQVDVSASTGSMTGVLSTVNGSPVATVLAERDYYRRGVAVPAALTGNYAVELTGAAGPTLPPGAGAARIRVTPSGTVAMAGRLSDGTLFSTGGYLSYRQHWGLYRPLYRNRGAITGWVDFPDKSPRSVSGTDLLWFRPAAPVRLFPAGWPGGIPLQLSGK